MLESVFQKGAYEKMNKDKLRVEIKNKLKKQTKEIIAQKSQKIAANLQKNSYFVSAKVICCYASFGFEVNTIDVLSEIINCGKILVVPRCNEGSSTVSLCKVETLSNLQKGHFGIPEPNQTCEIFTGEIDLFLVPGIAFTKEGKRLGRGKGYYDRLLNLHPNAKKIGLAFDLQIVKDIEVLQHDMFMDVVLTEK